MSVALTAVVFLFFDQYWLNSLGKVSVDALLLKVYFQYLQYA